MSFPLANPGRVDGHLPSIVRLLRLVGSGHIFYIFGWPFGVSYGSFLNTHEHHSEGGLAVLRVEGGGGKVNITGAAALMRQLVGWLPQKES